MGKRLPKHTALRTKILNHRENPWPHLFQPPIHAEDALGRGDASPIREDEIAALPGVDVDSAGLLLGWPRLGGFGAERDGNQEAGCLERESDLSFLS